jgi:hypothetical protein
MHVHHLPFNATKDDLKKEYSEYRDIRAIHHEQDRVFVFIVYYDGKSTRKTIANTKTGDCHHVKPAQRVPYETGLKPLDISLTVLLIPAVQSQLCPM